MPAQLVLATRNAHKVGELRAILAAAGVEVELVGMERDTPNPDDTVRSQDLLRFVCISVRSRRPSLASSRVS